MSSVTESVVSDRFVSIAPRSICESKLGEAAEKAKFSSAAEKNVLILSTGLAEIYQASAIGVIENTANNLDASQNHELATKVRQIAQSIPAANPS